MFRRFRIFRNPHWQSCGAAAKLATGNGSERSERNAQLRRSRPAFLRRSRPFAIRFKPLYSHFSLTFTFKPIDFHFQTH